VCVRTLKENPLELSTPNLDTYSTGSRISWIYALTPKLKSSNVKLLTGSYEACAAGMGMHLDTTAGVYHQAIHGEAGRVTMAACTLDYEWPAYVVVSLIWMCGGLLVMLLVRYVLRSSRSLRTSDRLHRCHKHLLNVQEAADTILSGDSLVSKTFVSFATTRDNSLTVN